MSTKEKLLEAALELFAENGYAATSTRDICRKAGVNSASIGYHFGDKRSLYRAVLEKEMCQHDSLHFSPNAETPKERLRQIVKVSIQERNRPKSVYRDKLAFRELSSPSTDLIEMLEVPIHRQVDLMKEILRELAPEGMDEETLVLSVLSVSGQIQYYHIFRQFLPSVLGEERARLLSDDEITEHIVNFTVAGLNGGQKA